MPFKLGPLELVIILVIVIVIFGIGKLPQMGSALGKTMKAFKTGQAEDEEEETLPRPRTRKKAAKRSATA
jgi:sec-independent protein translocase protein TatA